MTPTGRSGQGEICTEPSQCHGNLFCADGVCCDTPCNQPGESCVLPDQVGTCGGPQKAPAMSGPTQIAIVALLVVMGWLGLRALRRSNSD